MISDYAPRACVPVREHMSIEHPEDLPELVHYSDNALLVFTDFTRVVPVMTGTDTSINIATKQMKNAGVRLLLVVDKAGKLVGLISADDIMGDRPIRIAKDHGIDHSDVTVAMLMKPLAKILALDMEHLRDAKVGHIVATLLELEQKHLLVMDGDVVSGLFSASQISRQLGLNLMDGVNPAHSLAEMLHGLE